jgi:uncharacterized membrane protein (UPF0127 family)
VLGGCGSDLPVTPSLSGEITTAFAGLPLTIATIDDLELRVAVADTPGTRSRGLMGIDDLGVVEGMAFVFDAPTGTGFHMKDVLLPLDIAFVGTNGRVVDVLTMPRCLAEPCPIYHAAAPFQWALETPEGRLAGVQPGDAFSLAPWAP